MNKEIDGFESRLIEGLLTNKPFLEHFFGWSPDIWQEKYYESR